MRGFRSKQKPLPQTAKRSSVSDFRQPDTRQHAHDLKPLRNWVDGHVSDVMEKVAAGTNDLDVMSERLARRVTNERDRYNFYRKTLQLQDICFAELTLHTGTHCKELERMFQKVWNQTRALVGCTLGDCMHQTKTAHAAQRKLNDALALLRAQAIDHKAICKKLQSTVEGLEEMLNRSSAEVQSMSRQVSRLEEENDRLRSIVEDDIYGHTAHTGNSRALGEVFARMTPMLRLSSDIDACFHTVYAESKSQSRILLELNHLAVSLAADVSRVRGSDIQPEEVAETAEGSTQTIVTVPHAKKGRLRLMTADDEECLTRGRALPFPDEMPAASAAPMPTLQTQQGSGSLSDAAAAAGNVSPASARSPTGLRLAEGTALNSFRSHGSGSGSARSDRPLTASTGPARLRKSGKGGKGRKKRFARAATMRGTPRGTPRGKGGKRRGKAAAAAAADTASTADDGAVAGAGVGTVGLLRQRQQQQDSAAAAGGILSGGGSGGGDGAVSPLLSPLAGRGGGSGGGGDGESSLRARRRGVHFGAPAALSSLDAEAAEAAAEGRSGVILPSPAATPMGDGGQWGGLDGESESAGSDELEDIESRNQMPLPNPEPKRRDELCSQVMRLLLWSASNDKANNDLCMIDGCDSWGWGVLRGTDLLKITLQFFEEQFDDDYDEARAATDALREEISAYCATHIIPALAVSSITRLHWQDSRILLYARLGGMLPNGSRTRQLPFQVLSLVVSVLQKLRSARVKFQIPSAPLVPLPAASVIARGVFAGAFSPAKLSALIARLTKHASVEDGSTVATLTADRMIAIVVQEWVRWHRLWRRQLRSAFSSHATRSPHGVVVSWGDNLLAVVKQCEPDLDEGGFAILQEVSLTTPFHLPLSLSSSPPPPCGCTHFTPTLSTPDSQEEKGLASGKVGFASTTGVSIQLFYEMCYTHGYGRGFLLS